MPTEIKVVNEARELVKRRLAELDEERRRLERALVELGGKVTGRRGPGRRRGASAKGRPARKRRRRKGTRAEEAVKLVEKSPGINTQELAKAMKIKPNYLYRVLGDLEKEKRVKKKGRKYFPAG